MSTNINELISDKSRKVIQRHGLIEIIFDNIVDKVIDLINDDSKCKHIRIMMPYINHKGFLDMTKSKDSCQIVTTNEVKKRMKIFEGINVKTLQKGRGRKKSIIHTKCIILLDKNMVAYQCFVGSCNFSNGSSTNIENVMRIKNCNVANNYLDEFNRIYKIATKVSPRLIIKKRKR
jgi:phosphatidylserine/phosphatidylglycerophosphate/cardiolipin synthase-like enzyme